MSCSSQNGDCKPSRCGASPEKIYAPSRLACGRHFAEIALWRKKSAAYSAAYTNTSAMAWMHSCEPSVSRLPGLRLGNENKILVVAPYDAN
jgi:hypothetical protein